MPLGFTVGLCSKWSPLVVLATELGVLCLLSQLKASGMKMTHESYQCGKLTDSDWIKSSEVKA